MITQPAPLESDERPPAVCIGYPIWCFDPHRRVYQPRKAGEAYAHGGPIWKEHWRLTRVTGETPRLWIVNHGASKFPKTLGPSRQLPNGLAWTEAEVDRMAWAQDHKHAVANLIVRVDADTLARVARLLGYEPAPPP